MLRNAKCRRYRRRQQWSLSLSQDQITGLPVIARLANLLFFRWFFPLPELRENFRLLPVVMVVPEVG